MAKFSPYFLNHCSKVIKIGRCFSFKIFNSQNCQNVKLKYFFHVLFYVVIHTYVFIYYYQKKKSAGITFYTYSIPNEYHRSLIIKII